MGYFKLLVTSSVDFNPITEPTLDHFDSLFLRESGNAAARLIQAAYTNCSPSENEIQFNWYLDRSIGSPYLSSNVCSLIPISGPPRPPSPDWMRDFITQDDWLCPLTARCPGNLMIAGVAPAID
ncbi:hypothetical protein PGT21_011278 [Puccinia graminis f. sp. tritici]|uniref:Uncharacterized protein n=1 Tax=Puccinia graminis f. sp. tritici TaxID=56615 RepID=A0A5B0QT67_PUCGR|nr:hypothetical protein PGT21_011278 [Puccinia graminis f. sp. tritici]